jgi:hypothetical protein
MRRRRGRAIALAICLVAGVVAFQLGAPYHQPTWWGPPALIEALLMQVAWRARRRWIVAAALVAAAVVVSAGLDPAHLVLLRFAMLVYVARQVSRLLDVTYWFIQPLAAAVALGAAELFALLNQFLWFAQVARTPSAILLATTLVAPLLHPFCEAISAAWSREVD